MVRRPGNSLYGSDMGAKNVDGLVVCAVPDEEFIVVSAGCELTFFRIPAKAADFLFVGREFAEVVVGYSYISMENCPIS